MYPTHHWCYRSRPSRLLWFLVGAGFTFWWTKRHERNSPLPPHCTRYKLPPAPTQADYNGQNPGWPQNINDVPGAINAIPSPDASAPSSAPTPRDGWRWDPTDREHMEKVSKQAVDTMADLTESTLDSVMSMAVSLKAKLAEHRAQQDKTQVNNEYRKNPPLPSDY